MKLYINTTSPFARIVRIAVIEKGLEGRIESEIVDPWADPPDFLKANPAGRVPCLVLNDGSAISEALMIVNHLDRLTSAPALLPDAPAVLARAGDAIAAFDASTAIIIGRKSSPDFDGHMVGKKRWRTMESGLARLDVDCPPDFADSPDLSAVAAATLVDYILFRFPDRDWLSGVPRLAAWRERQRDRRSLVETMPFI